MQAAIESMGLQAPIKDWLIAIIEKRFRWEDGVWLIV